MRNVCSNRHHGHAKSYERIASCTILITVWGRWFHRDASPCYSMSTGQKTTTTEHLWTTEHRPHAIASSFRQHPVTVPPTPNQSSGCLTYSRSDWAITHHRKMIGCCNNIVASIAWDVHHIEESSREWALRKNTSGYTSVPLFAWARCGNLLSCIRRHTGGFCHNLSYPLSEAIACIEHAIYR